MESGLCDSGVLFLSSLLLSLSFLRRLNFNVFSPLKYSGKLLTNGFGCRNTRVVIAWLLCVYAGIVRDSDLSGLVAVSVCVW